MLIKRLTQRELATELAGVDMTPFASVAAAIEALPRPEGAVGEWADHIVDSLTDDLRHVTEFVIPGEGERGRWGPREWYLTHRLQPVLDHWHSAFWPSLCDYVDEEDTVAVAAAVRFWWAVGKCFFPVIAGTAGLRWFRRNWFRRLDGRRSCEVR